MPFSAQLGLINGSSLTFSLLLVPAIIGGLFLGRTAVAKRPQKWFDSLRSPPHRRHRQSVTHQVSTFVTDLLSTFRVSPQRAWSAPLKLAYNE